jgi:hypothetical protein
VASPVLAPHSVQTFVSVHFSHFIAMDDDPPAPEYEPNSQMQADEEIKIDRPANAPPKSSDKVEAEDISALVAQLCEFPSSKKSDVWNFFRHPRNDPYAAYCCLASDFKLSPNDPLPVITARDLTDKAQKLCLGRYTIGNTLGTSSLLQHLLRRHGINVDKKRSRDEASQKLITSLLSPDTVRADQLLDLFSLFMLNSSLPFTVVEDVFLREFVRRLGMNNSKFELLHRTQQITRLDRLILSIKDSVRTLHRTKDLFLNRIALNVRCAFVVWIDNLAFVTYVA